MEITYSDEALQAAIIEAEKTLANGIKLYEMYLNKFKGISMGDIIENLPAITALSVETRKLSKHLYKQFEKYFAMTENLDWNSGNVYVSKLDSIAGNIDTLQFEIGDLADKLEELEEYHDKLLAMHDTLKKFKEDI